MSSPDLNNTDEALSNDPPYAKPEPTVDEREKQRSSASNRTRDAINAASQVAVPRSMSRMEFAQSLMLEHQDSRLKWEVQKEEMIAKAGKSAESNPEEYNVLTRKLAHQQGVENEKIASKYADAIVRGHSHTVRELMGHLDIKTLAERLQDAKDSRRESALNSLYTASEVYPVQMQPGDWFQDLDTGFTPEDSSQNPQLIKAAIEAKSSFIDSLENQIAQLRGFYKGDPKVLKETVETKTKILEAARAKLSSKYTQSTVDAVKLAIQAYMPATAGAAAINEADVNEAQNAATALKSSPDSVEKNKLQSLLGPNLDKLDDIATEIDAVTKANSDVNEASRLLIESMREYAEAKSGDNQIQVENIQRHLTKAKKDVEELYQSFIISSKAEALAKDKELKTEDLINYLQLREEVPDE